MEAMLMSANLNFILKADEICLEYCANRSCEAAYFLMRLCASCYTERSIFLTASITNGHYKDFGYGFYCTSLERQARRWALTKRKKHIVNTYEYTTDSALHICRFEKMSDEWLDFIVSCRRGIEHDFDIVEGPMADDTIWDYIEDYVAGNISKEAFWMLVKFKYPTHQIVFCTGSALETLHYEGSYEI